MNEIGQPPRQLSSDEKRALLASLLRQRARQEGQSGPLSHGQRSLWMLQQRDPGNAAYNTAFSMRLRSAVDREALSAALRALVMRHEALRTTFTAKDGRPVAVIRADGEIRLTCVDARLWDANRLRQAVAADYRQPFDLASGPLLRASLFSQADDDHVLLLALHHIACDAWSIWILVHELGVLYAAMVSGRPGELPPVATQYRHFVARQQRFLGGDEGEQAWRHWRQQLGGELPVLDLPADHPRPAIQGMRGATHRFEVAAPALQGLHALGKASGTTLFMNLLAIFQVLLHRHSLQDDIIVGSPAAGRGDPAMAATVGYLTNPLPLRADLSGDPTFQAFLAQVRQTVLGGLAHQEMPFPLIVERLQPKRDPSRWPVIEAMLVLQRPPRSEAFHALLTAESTDRTEWAGMTVQPYAMAQMEGQLDLTLEIVEGRNVLACAFKFNRDLFEPDTVCRWEGHFRTLIDAVIADPGRPVSRLPLMPAMEREQVLTGWQGADVPYPLDRCLHHWVAAQAQRTPDRIAVRMDGPGQDTLSYRELDARSQQLAYRLSRLGVGPDHVVGVFAERSLDMVVALLGVLKAGGAYLPLDPELPRARLDLIIDDARPTAIVTQAGLASRLAVSGCAVVDLGAAADPADDPPPLRPAAADDLAYVIYTSGSTGQPKGVENTHRGICNRLLWMQDAYRLDQTDRVLQKTPFTFDVSVWEFFWPLMTGATLVMARPGSHRNREYLVDCICRQSITTLHFVPTMLQVFLGSARISACRGQLRRVFCSGEALPLSVQRRFGEHFDAELHNLYGPTEAAVDVTFWHCRPDTERRSVPIGRPIANLRVYLLDRHLQPVPVGVIGELYIAGVGLARGYRNRADLTAAVFIPAPPYLSREQRLYRTGDLCRWLADGTIEYLRRADLQVKLRGIRIEPGDVEAAIKAHPLIEEAVVRLEGSGIEARLLAWLVPRSAGEAPDQADLRHFLRERLSEPMIPSVFMPLDSLPFGGNGKLDTAALPRPATDVTSAATDQSVSYTDAERRIAAIWQAVLDRPPPGIDDNFFDLGGHSLLLAEVQTRLDAAFGYAPSMVELFQLTTIGMLVRFYARRDGPPSGEAAQARPSPATDGGAIAIIGMAGRFPGAADVNTLWRNLCEGIEGITIFTDAQLAAAGAASVSGHPNHVPAFGALADIELFDAGFFGLSPREAELTDVQHRLLLECAWTALEHAGHDPATEDRRYGVFAGVGMNRYLLNNLMSHRDLLEQADGYQLMLGNDKDFAPTRISYKLNLTGPSVSVQTACSTSLVAVHMACRSLLSGECDTALAGGCSVMLPQDTGYLFEEGMILSPDGHCRAFDADSNGTVGGNGVGVVVLKRLNDALADSDTVHAVIRGSAVNNDGAAKVGYTAPSVAGQAAAISAAVAAAGISPDAIGYVEAHGTGTPLGDPIEIAALTRVFRTANETTGRCAIGSIKTNIGHLDTAAGVAGLIKAALAVQHGVVPPSLHFRQANPALDLPRSPFFVADTAQSWPDVASKRYAGVSSFGIGGTNAHVVLEQPPDRPAAMEQPYELLCLSARDAEALDEAASRLARHLLEHSTPGLGDVAFTLACGRRAFGHRRFLVCRDPAEAAFLLADATATSGSRRLQGSSEEASAGSVAFMLTGQGAQHVGMAAQTYRTRSVFRQHLDACADLLAPRLGLDLRALLYPPPEARASARERLTQTRFAQPALFAVEYALAQLWMSWGVKPEALIGHSLGEYVAACLAGVWTLADALDLVAVRGALMQAEPPGGMLAVGLPETAVRQRLRPGLSIAAVNGDELCVVSGPHAALAELTGMLMASDVACHELQTSHAFHSPMMAPAANRLLSHLRQMTFRRPEIPFVSNVSGDWIEPQEAVSPDYWIRHLLQPVRFADGLATLLRQPGRVLIEVGPGNVLANLAMRHKGDPGARVVLTSLPRPQGEPDDLPHLLDAVGRLWLAGGRLDWGAFHAGLQRRRVPLPGYPFRKRRHWIEAGRTADSAGMPERKELIADWFYAPSWQRTPRSSASPRPGSRWLLFMDTLGVGEELAARLRRCGADVVTVAAGRRFAKNVGDAAPGNLTHAARGNATDFQIDAGSAADHQALMEALSRTNRLPDVVIHLWNVTAEAAASPSDVRACGFHSLIGLARARFEAAPERPCHIVVVSTGLHYVSGNDVPEPAKALLLGPVVVIPQEFRSLTCSSIDLDLSPRHREGQIAQLLSDAACDGRSASVAYRGAHRWVQVFVPMSLPDSLPSPAISTWMITGGTGGLGLGLAEWLARTVPGVKLALISRTGAGGRDADADSVCPDLCELEAVGRAAQLVHIAHHPVALAVRRQMESVIDRLCQAHIADLLQRSGIVLHSGRRYDPAELRRRLNLARNHERWFEFLLHVLLEDEVLSEDATGSLIVGRQPPADQIATIRQQLQDRYPELTPIADLLQHCADQLGSVLCDAIEPLSVIYPDGQLDLRGAAQPLTHILSERVQYTALLSEIIRHIQTQARRKLRILEVGGGGGELTQAMMQALRGMTVEYCFTDVGRSILAEAQRRAAALDLPAMQFAVLDIFRDPEEQDFTPGAYDLILAMDVVHAARRIDVALGHLRRLLAPGGVLCLLESCRPCRYLNMIWGFARGWWQFEDDELRRTSPLLGIGQWQAALREAGFAATAAWPDDASAGEYALILAQTPLSAVPSTSDIRPVERLRQLGAEVLAIRADVSDAMQMRRAVSLIRSEFGSLDGVIHAAGIAGGGTIEMKTPEGAESEFAAKVDGTRVLVEVLGDAPLEAFVLCSSLTSATGGFGQVAYSAANAFLDAFAEARAALVPDQRIVAINWDRWRNVGMAAALEARHRELTGSELDGGMRMDEATEVFGRILAALSRQHAASPRIIVSARDFPALVEQSRCWQLGQIQAQMDRVALHTRPRPRTDTIGPEGEVETYIARIWQEELGIEQIGASDDFFALGGDSLIAIRLASRLRRALQVPLNARTLYETPTVAALGVHVASLQWIAQGAPATDGTEEPLQTAQEEGIL
jgi:amino acid adenylation domain-containing protein